MQRFSEIATYFLVSAAIVIFFLIGIPKIFFPYEAHYMESSMIQSIARISSGLPLYCKPSIHYIPWLYEPLYYYTGAAITSVTGMTFVTARLPSILSTIALCSLLYFVLRKETEKFFFSIAGPGLLLAAFSKTEFCLIHARTDSLFTFLLLAAVVLVYYSRSNTGLICGALILSLSIFTKQTGLLFVVPIASYLWFYRGWKRMLIFFAAVSIITIAGSYLMNVYTEGWYRYYTFLIPRAKGKTLRLEYAISGIFFYAFLRCWGISILALFSMKYLFRDSDIKRERSFVYFGLVFLTAIIAGFFGILNTGGEHNVFLPMAAACGFFLPLIVSELSSHLRFSKMSLWLIPAQLIFLISYPWREPFNITGEIAKKREEQLLRQVTSLPGEIWTPFHNYYRNYASLNQMEDILLVEDSVAHDFRYQLDTAFQNKHWSFILSPYPNTFPRYTISYTIPNQYKISEADSILFYVSKPNE